jgi:hypothetical protein
MANLLSLLAWHGVAIIFAAFWTAPMWDVDGRPARDPRLHNPSSRGLKIETSGRRLVGA